MATKTKPKSEEKAVKEEVIKEEIKASETGEKQPCNDFFERKLKAINNLNNPAKARRYAKWLFMNKRGI